MNEHLPSAAAITIALVVSLLVGVMIGGAVTSDEFRDYINQSEQWCENRDGELVNVNGIWDGGLHCDLPNGTSVHMQDINLNST